MKHHTLFRFAVAFAVYVLAPLSEVRAEIVYKIPGDIGWKKALPLQHVLDADVIEDLGLSADVAQKLKQLHVRIAEEVNAENRKSLDDILNKPGNDGRTGPRESYAEIFHRVCNRYTNELNELLTSQQQERLYQIHIQKQRQPTDALSDSGIAKALGLTDAQRAQIYQIHLEVMKAELHEIKSVDRHTGPNSNSLRSACPAKIMKLLSDEQRQAFEKLQGKPLNVKRRWTSSSDGVSRLHGEMRMLQPLPGGTGHHEEDMPLGATGYASQ